MGNCRVSQDANLPLVQGAGDVIHILVLMVLSMKLNVANLPHSYMCCIQNWPSLDLVEPKAEIVSGAFHTSVLRGKEASGLPWKEGLTVCRLHLTACGLWTLSC